MKLVQLLVLALVVGCAGNLIPMTPEGKIQFGANSVVAATALGGTLAKNGKITKAQATSYGNILHTISAHLDTSNDTLLACRKTTGSTARSIPDPCVARIEADITLALTLVDDVQKTLRQKE